MHPHCASQHPLCAVCDQYLAEPIVATPRGPCHAACGARTGPAPQQAELFPREVRDLAKVGAVFLAVVVVVAILGAAAKSCKRSNTTTSSSGSSVVSVRPDECDYLADQGLSTGLWREGLTASERVCVATGVTQGGNNVEYFVYGTSSRATQMHLVANVFKNEGRTTETHVVFERKAQALVKRACGASLPPAASAALKAGTKGRWTICGLQAELSRENWPTGLGYDMAFDLNL